MDMEEQKTKYFRITHNDDGKEKWQSHTVEVELYLTNRYDDEPDIRFSFYDNSKENAVEQMKNAMGLELDNIIAKILNLREALRAESYKIIESDGLGNEIL